MATGPHAAGARRSLCAGPLPLRTAEPPARAAPRNCDCRQLLQALLLERVDKVPLRPEAERERHPSHGHPRGGAVALLRLHRQRLTLRRDEEANRVRLARHEIDGLLRAHDLVHGLLDAAEDTKAARHKVEVQHSEKNGFVIVSVETKRDDAI